MTGSDTYIEQEQKREALLLASCRAMARPVALEFPTKRAATNYRFALYRTRNRLRMLCSHNRDPRITPALARELGRLKFSLNGDTILTIWHPNGAYIQRTEPRNGN